MVVRVYREVECIALVPAGRSEIVKETHINRTMNYSPSFKTFLLYIHCIHHAYFCPVNWLLFVMDARLRHIHAPSFLHAVCSFYSIPLAVEVEVLWL